MGHAHFRKLPGWGPRSPAPPGPVSPPLLGASGRAELLPDAQRAEPASCLQGAAAATRPLRGHLGARAALPVAASGWPTSGRPGPAVAIPVSLRPRGPPEPPTMPLGLKPTCSVCKPTSSSVGKQGPKGAILRHRGAGRGGAGCGAPARGGRWDWGRRRRRRRAPRCTSAAAPQSSGSGGGRRREQETHRRSARLRDTECKSAPAAEKKVSTEGKGRRRIFKLKNPIKAPECFSHNHCRIHLYKGVYYQIGDVVSVIDEQDGKPYYAQIRGFIQDQYCEKSAALTWLIPTLSSPRDQFDPASYIIGEFDQLYRFLNPVNSPLFCKTVLVCSGCHNKIPQTEWVQQLFSQSSGSWKSKIKVLL